MDEMRTKQGYVMNRKLRQRFVELLAEGVMTNKEMAEALGVNRRTLTDYMTDYVVQDALNLRLERRGEVGIEDVDKAMMAQACSGNVQAAKLVYLRMAQKGELEVLPTLDELEAELQALKKDKDKDK